MNWAVGLALVLAGMVFGPGVLLAAVAATVTAWRKARSRWQSGHTPGDALLVCALIALAGCGWSIGAHDWWQAALGAAASGLLAYAARTEWEWAELQAGVVS